MSLPLLIIRLGRLDLYTDPECAKFRALGVCVHSGWVLRGLARGPTNKKMAFISVRRLLSILKESKHKKCCIFFYYFGAVEPNWRVDDFGPPQRTIRSQYHYRTLYYLLTAGACVCGGWNVRALGREGAI
jgi:hypothetical protein